MNPILYVVLNGELNMSSGKAASQAVHASKMLGASKDFTAEYKRTVIILEAKNSEQIRNLHEYLKIAGIESQYYIDEGNNEVDAFSLTALAVYPFDSEDTEKREIFDGLNLYSSKQVDEDDGNYCESEQSTVNRTIFAIHTQLNSLAASLAPRPKKPRWYTRLFKRKQKRFIS